VVGEGPSRPSESLPKPFARFGNGRRRSVVLTILRIPVSTDDILNTTLAIVLRVAKGMGDDYHKTEWQGWPISITFLVACWKVLWR
jgi:hypothetical protein